MVDEEEDVVQEEEQESVHGKRGGGSVSFSSGGREGDFWDLLEETVVEKEEVKIVPKKETLSISVH